MVSAGNTKWTLRGTTQYHWVPAKLSCFDSNSNFVVAILDGLFKTGFSVTQWWCVVPGTLSVLLSRHTSVNIIIFEAHIIIQVIYFIVFDAKSYEIID